MGLCRLPGGGMGEIKGKGDGMYGQGDKTRMKKLGRIKSREGSSSLFFVVEGFRTEMKKNRFPLKCIISCDNRILEKLIL